MNICRWCGGKSSKSTTFCSSECAGAAAELPDLVNKNPDPTPYLPRRVASPKSSWALGLLAGALLGVGVTMAMGTAETPTKKATPRCQQVMQARTQVKAITMDFIQNGLAGIWDGRVDEAQDLDPWFIDGNSTEIPMTRIFRDQNRRFGTQLINAEVIDVRLASTLDHAAAEFFIEVDEVRGQNCYTGTFQWISQEDGTWLRTKASILRRTACQ